ncbi:hypothetical protein BH18ACT9_BH18ACT9_06840 [soil metagenome]
MSLTRVYLPSTWPGLRDLVLSDGLGPPPLWAHAVTPGLRQDYPEGGEEEWEYAALSAAARSSLTLITQDDLPRRVVIAMDAETVLPGETADPTVVQVDEAVPFRHVAAVLVDSADAQADVSAARQAWPAADRGDPQAAALVDRCLSRELGWFATQEISTLLAE